MTGRGLVYGVTGLPCAGKSLAAGLLASGEATGEAGILVKADDLGHAVLVRPDVVERLRERFGAALFDGAGPTEIRARIAGRVFADPAELAWLEALVHPLVAGETAKIVADAGGRPVVVEAALLFAADMDRDCDVVVLVEAPFDVRLERARGRGWDRGELERRDRRLMPLFSPARRAACGDKLVVVPNAADDGLLGARMGDVLAAKGR